MQRVSDMTLESNARQTPSSGEVYLDHVAWFVPEMDQASRAFERLGFFLTPYVEHRAPDPRSGAPSPTGTANRCAMLSEGYLEILGVVNGFKSSLSSQHRAAIERYVGVHLIAFAVADPVSAHAQLEAEGFEPLPPVHLRRPLGDPNAGEAIAFTVIRVPTEKMEEGRIQILCHETPELAWKPQLMAHENSIAALAGVLLCVDAPRQAAERYGRFLHRPATGNAMHASVYLDRGRIDFVTKDRCDDLLPSFASTFECTAPFIPALSLVAQDVARARDFFLARGVTLEFADEGMFCLGPTAAMGAAIVIHGRERAWPPTAGEC